MSKSLAQAARVPAARPSILALAMALSVGVVALAPDAAFAGKNNNNGNAGNKGNSGGSVPVTMPLCKLSDIAPGAAACSGFFQGNLLSNNASDLSAQAGALAAIGLANWTGALVEPQMNLSSSAVNFGTALNGDTWVGVHFGAGTNSPSPHTPGGVTAFYRFDAGTNLDAFTLAFGSASAARLYATGPAPIIKPVITPPVENPIGVAVPEPGAWALMILGFGAAGAMLRRRRALVAAV